MKSYVCKVQTKTRAGPATAMAQRQQRRVVYLGWPAPAGEMRWCIQGL
jgi:hypothetical protein